MKNIGILLFLLIPSYLLADDVICEDEFFNINGHSDWLQRSGDDELIPNGLDCNASVTIRGSNAVVGDTAYFSKHHEPGQQVQFQFTLLTNDLLESFGVKDQVELYAFNSISILNDTEIEKVLLKIHLQKTFSGWNLNFNWYSKQESYNDSFTPVVQTMSFDDTDYEIEVFFFWSGTEWTDNSSMSTKGNDYSHSHSGSGLVISQYNSIPQVFMNPYRWTYQTDNLSGLSRLGYINADNNPALQDDTMFFLSSKVPSSD